MGSSRYLAGSIPMSRKISLEAKNWDELKGEIRTNRRNQWNNVLHDDDACSC